MLPLDSSVAFDGEAIVPTDAAHEPWEDAEAGEPDEIVALLPTGGTTGAPKVVPLSNRNVVSSAIASMLAGGLRLTIACLVALPIFHVGGAFVGSLAALGAGATMVLPTAGGFRNPDVVANYWRIIEARNESRSAGWCRPDWALPPPSDGPGGRFGLHFSTGASVCPPEIERRFLDVWSGDCVRRIYGMTEFAGAITHTP